MEFRKMSDILSCPICLEISTPPIFQCGKGHLICHECIINLDSDVCPICRLPNLSKGTPIRALALEQLASSMFVKCSNDVEGCKALGNVETMKRHIKSECPFEPRDYCTPLGLKCKTLVPFSKVQEHITTQHGVKNVRAWSHRKIMIGNVCVCSFEEEQASGDQRLSLASSLTTFTQKKEDLTIFVLAILGLIASLYLSYYIFS